MGPRDLPTGLADRGTLLRLPGEGGTAVLYRADSLAPVGWQVPRNVPAIRRALGTDVDDEMVYAVDQGGNVVGIDLKVRQSRPYLSGTDHVASAADGVVLGLDKDRHPLRFAGRNRTTFRATVTGGSDVRLVPAAGDRIVAYAPGAGTLQVFEEEGEVKAIEVPRGQLTSTWAGDLLAITTDSGVLLAYASPARTEKPQFVRIKGAPITSAFSPSGHRLYVARARGDVLLLDRFSADPDEVGDITLPGPATAIRTDRSGRWLLARPERGDSVWLVDLVRAQLVATLPSPWADDLPLVSGGRTLVVREGTDVAAWDIGGSEPVRTGRLRGAAGDVFLAVPWQPRDRRGAPLPVDDAALAEAPSPGETVDSLPATEQDDATSEAQAPTPGQYSIQVTSSQNRKYAEALAEQLSQIGFRAKVYDPAQDGDGFKVLIGPYATREEAEADGKRLGKPYFIRTPSDRQP